MTPLTEYWDTGRKAAEAHNEEDDAATHSDHFRKARAAEPETRRAAASDAYHRAYRLYRKI